MRSLWNELEKYTKSDIYPMHMPGHKRNREMFPEQNFYEMDITEIEGFDDLQESKGVLEEIKKRAARLYGADESYLLVNGSTVGILAGISACIKKGDKILMARNCHKSVYNAVFLKGAKPIYLYPDYLESCFMNGSISAVSVSEQLKEHPDIRLVVLVSPTYEGVVSDIAAIACEVHKKGIPLFVDEAHGAHLGFSDSFPKSAVMQGADLVVQSVHKTLPGFTQSALLHRIGDRIDGERVQQYLNCYQSSSPSYILMSGLDRSMLLLEEKSDVLMKSYQEKLDYFYKETKTLRSLQVFYFKQEQKNKCNVYNWDSSKIIIFTTNTDMTGNELCQKLRQDYRIQMEMASMEYVLGMTSVCDTWEGFYRLLHALKEIDQSCVYIDNKENSVVGKIEPPEQIYLPWETEDMKACHVIPDKGEGSISLTYLYVYPPGSPFLVPGERISGDCVKQIQQYLKAGLTVRGLDAANRIKIAKVD